MHVTMDDGAEGDLGPGDAFVISPGHDAWIVGDEACVALEWSAAGDYAGAADLSRKPNSSGYLGVGGIRLVSNRSANCLADGLRRLAWHYGPARSAVTGRCYWWYEKPLSQRPDGEAR